jgi:hypothetical protein
MRTITNVTNVLVIDSLSASPPAIIQGSLVQTLFPLYVEFVLYMARTYSSLFINSYIRTLTQNIPARNTSIKEQYLVSHEYIKAHLKLLLFLHKTCFKLQTMLVYFSNI